jgi:hypothetical protein
MAVQTWERVAPLFALSGTKCEVVKTKSVGHAFNMMDQASESDLHAWDGIVVVGGDGLFNEVLNGLLIGRHYAPPPVVPQRSVSAEETGRERGGQGRASDQVRTFAVRTFCCMEVLLFLRFEEASGRLNRRYCAPPPVVLQRSCRRRKRGGSGGVRAEHRTRCPFLYIIEILFVISVFDLLCKMLLGGWISVSTRRHLLCGRGACRQRRREGSRGVRAEHQTSADFWYIIIDVFCVLRL